MGHSGAAPLEAIIFLGEFNLEESSSHSTFLRGDLLKWGIQEPELVDLPSMCAYEVLC